MAVAVRVADFHPLRSRDDFHEVRDREATFLLRDLPFHLHDLGVNKNMQVARLLADREVDHGHVFHTLLAAVGVDSKGEFDIGGRKFPVADPAKGPIKELLV